METVPGHTATWAPAPVAEICVWPLKSLAVPRTRTSWPTLTSTGVPVEPLKTKMPSELSGLVSWSATSSCT
jgi:hypothetical protein